MPPAQKLTESARCVAHRRPIIQGELSKYSDVTSIQVPTSVNLSPDLSMLSMLPIEGLGGRLSFTFVLLQLKIQL
jgi:hypothetical protein